MEIYLYIVAATLILGVFMPQKGRERFFYIVLMTAVHMFICSFRYEHLTGDLKKYHWTYMQLANSGWLSQDVLQGGRNFGFFLLMKLVSELTNGDFQMLLIIISAITYTALGYMIYRYSPSPWMSFLTWSCMAFFIFSLSAIKQSLAMAFVMLSFIGIAEKKPKIFFIMMALAGAIHVPALVFLPAYWMSQMRVNQRTLMLYLLFGILLYIFKNQFIQFIKSFYYDDDEVFFFSGEIGSRFIMLLGFTLFSVLLKGFPERHLEQLFHIMAIATILQMLSGFDNIFTRLTDYYFQFSVLYIPMIFFQNGENKQQSLLRPVFPFNARSMKALAVLICVFMLWFYWTYNINISIAYSVDNYLNFRFMWDAQ